MSRWLEQDVLERGAAARPGRRAAGLTDGRSSRSRGCSASENVASAIVGASRPEQVRDNATASGIDLDPETLAELEQILS